MAKSKRTATQGRGSETLNRVGETVRRNAWPIAGAAVAGLAAAAALFLGRRANAPAAGHAAPDLERDEHPGAEDRADPHFRPDMDAPMSKADRDALAPALGRPSLVD